IDQPGHRLGKGDDEDQDYRLQHHEGDGALVNFTGGQFTRGDTLQVEEREAHRWRDKGHLQVDCHDNAKPDHVDADGGGGGDEQWHGDKGDFDKLQEDAQQEDGDVADDDKAEEAARHSGEQFGHQPLPAKAIKDDAKEGGAEEDHDDEG